MVPAFRSSEDTGLLRDLNAVSTGYFIGEPGLHYRVWPGQTTAQRVCDDERKAVLRLVGMRADELLDGVGAARSNRDAHQVDSTVTETVPNV